MARASYLPPAAVTSGATAGIATARFTLQHTGRGQHLGGVTDGGNRLVGICEMAHHFQNARVEPEVFRRPAAGNHERVVIVGANLVEGRIQSEVVASLLAVGLVSLEIVDRGPHRIASPLVRTDGMDGRARP